MIPVTLQPGQCVVGEHGGSFRIIEWIGEGSYARVYRATGPDGPAALKLAKREVPEAEERLARESRAHAVLKHPAIPCSVDAGRTGSAEGHDDGTSWLAREWVEGDTLSKRLQTGRSLPLIRVIPCLTRIADALAAIHGAGWTHADVRPDNVLLEAETETAFLFDLGEACCYEGDGHSLPSTAREPRRPLIPVIRQRRSPLPNPETKTEGSRASPERDLRQLGELLAWSLTGVDPAIDPERLSLATGHHPTAVRLFQECRGGRLTSAAGFRDRLERLGHHLGLTAAGRRR